MGPSPDWAQKQLRAIGVQPLNNVVDATNLVLHEFGNPLHAFDLDKIGGGQIVVRKATQGEPFTTLDGERRELDAKDLVIADAAEPMCLAGVYGGGQWGVGRHDQGDPRSGLVQPGDRAQERQASHPQYRRELRFERGVDPNTVRLAAERLRPTLDGMGRGAGDRRHKHVGTATVQDAQVDLDLGWLGRFLGSDIE